MLDEIDIVWGDAPHGVSASPSTLTLGGVSGSTNIITVGCGYAWETLKTEGSDNFNVSIEGKVITVTSLHDGGVSEAKIGTLRIKESADANYYTDVEIRQSAAPAHGVSAAASATLDGDNGSTQTVSVTCNYNWEVLVTEGDTKISASKTNATTVTITALADGPASEGKVGTIRIREVSDNSYYADVTINQKPKEVFYRKVTSAPSDWSGTYLIVNETNSAAFDGTYNGTNGAKDASVTISSSKVASNSTVDGYAVTITKVGSHYSIKHGDNYLGWASGNKAQPYDNTDTDNALNDFAISDGAAIIKNAKDNARILRYNTGVTQANGRFRYYTTETGTVAVLYKKD